MSEIMEPLPKNWIKTKIKDLLQVEYGKSLTKSERADAGEFPVVGSSGIVGCHNQCLIEGPSIVIGRKGSVGSLTLLEKSCWPIDTVYYVQPVKGLDIKYIYYQLIIKKLGELDRSTTIPGLNRDDLYEVDFVLCSTDEQTRIVEKLEELLSDLDDGVAELKAAQAKLTQYRQSLLKSAVEGSLTAEWRAKNKPAETGEQLLKRILMERRKRWEMQKLAEFKEKGQKPPKDWQKKYPEPVAPDTSELPELPEGWVWASLDMVIEDINSGKSFKCHERPPVGEEYGVIKVSAVTWGEFNEDESKTCMSKDFERVDLLIRVGDFLISRANTTELVGACVIVEHVTKNVMLSDKIWRVNCIYNYLSGWIMQFLRGPLGRKQVESSATGNQASMKNISQEKLRSFAFPLPSEEEIEHSLSNLNIVFKLVDEQRQSNSNRLKMAEVQRKNILKDAFAGRLIEQNPSDEPASLLLKRIMEERSLLEGKPRMKHQKKAKSMNKIEVEAVKSWIRVQEEAFTFDAVRSNFDGSYEALKNIIFGLLEEKRPIIKQIFDKRRKCLVFERV